MTRWDEDLQEPSWKSLKTVLTQIHKLFMKFKFSWILTKSFMWCDHWPLEALWSSISRQQYRAPHGCTIFRFEAYFRMFLCRDVFWPEGSPFPKPTQCRLKASHDDVSFPLELHRWSRYNLELIKAPLQLYVSRWRSRSRNLKAHSCSAGVGGETDLVNTSHGGGSS